jgi:DNA polymerase III alpha subunit
MLPIFRSNFSLTSILTLDPATDGEPPKNRPKSIFQICKDYKLKDAYIVDNTLTGLVDAYENAKKSGINLRFGYRVPVCQDITNKTPESTATESKFIIFAKRDSFKSLIKLHNISTTDGIHNGKPRLDFDSLKNHWDNSLILAVPFYDSYLHHNILFGTRCVPEIDFTDAVYFNENNELPFDRLLQKHLAASVPKSNILNSKTIYYKNRSDFKAYMTYRCILNRSTFQKPELQHFGSMEFCMESWKEGVE